jgi:hypothetical protein
VEDGMRLGWQELVIIGIAVVVVLLLVRLRRPD